MRHERIDVWENSEYSYPAAFGFQPNLRTYLHEDGEDRPCVLVIPGGGYRMVAPSEGEIVAKWFYDHGYQAFVGTYTTDYLGMNPLKTQPLKDLSRIMMRKNLLPQITDSHIRTASSMLSPASKNPAIREYLSNL